jgi:hypothetical protein
MAGQFEEEAIQIGCDADRDDLFIDPITGRTDFMDFPKYRSLSRFCNMYRGIEWTNDKGGQNNINLYDDEYMLDLARKEIMPTFGVAVFDDDSDNLENMNKTLESLLAAVKKYRKNLVGVITCYDYKNRGINNTLHLINKFNAEGLECRGLDHLNREDVHMHFVKEYDTFIQMTHASHFIRMDAGQTVGPNLFVDVDKTLNENMEKILCFESNGVLAIQSKLLRSKYLDFGGYQKAEQGIKEAAVSEGYYKKYG